jgi:hypothetical protein
MTHLFFHVLIAAAIAGAVVLAVPRVEHRLHRSHRIHRTYRFRPPAVRMEPPQAIGAMFALMLVMWALLAFTPR